MDAERWPTELRVSGGGRELRVAFDQGNPVALPAELLRVESPSAEVQGHGPGQKTLVAGKRGVRIVGAEPVGSYAVKLVFDDGHATGLFTWSYLDELARDREAIEAEYVRRLAAAGLSRDAKT